MNAAAPESCTVNCNQTKARQDLPPAERCRAPQLAALFAEEPELILACLQGIDKETPAAARTILAASQLAIKACPEYADLRCFAAQAAVVAGDFDTAANILERALELNPNYKAALILAARVAVLREQPQHAVALAETAVDLGADYPDVHLLLGNVWRKRGEPTRARKAYQRALDLNANLAPARAALDALQATEPSGSRHELPA